MHNILLIAKREYLEQIRGRAFRLSTISVPLLLAVLAGVMHLYGHGVDTSEHVVVASNDAVLAADIRTQLRSGNAAGSVVDVLAPATAEDRAALLKGVRTKAIDGFLWVETDAGKEPAAVYESASPGDFITDALGSALNRAVVRERLTERGIQGGNADALLKNVKVETLQVNNAGKEVKSNVMTSFYKGYLMAFLLTMTTMVYGLNVGRSIIQEKTSRIFEVMLAIAKPGDMLAGKLIGVGAVGLTQILIWAVFGAAIAGSALVGPILSGTLSIHFSWIEGVLFPVYFVLGFLLYAALFAGLAATCETEQEMQMYAPLAALPVWLSFALIVLVVNNPDSLLSIAASLFPATAPIIMMLRMGLQPPPLWQTAASIGIMILSIWAVLWVSSRLYRVGILMYGKRATIPELLRWLRYS